MQLQLIVFLITVCNFILLACNQGVKEGSVIPSITNDQSTMVSSWPTVSPTPPRERKSSDIYITGVLTSVGKWKRFEVSYNNPSWIGNPFDVEFRGVFTHIPSGRVVTQLGFYAGNDIWKIYFMPEELGTWSYITESPDSDLNGKSGSFNCITSGLPGKLIASGNRWILSDSKAYVAPVLLPAREWFKSTSSGNEIDNFINWADQTVGALIIGTTLVYFTQPQDSIPYIKGQEGETFNIPMWDRLNDHYDNLRDRGMGLYIMFYSDDRDAPTPNGISPMSLEEKRLFRYAVARFSAYPIVMWDTGIDIGETRSNSWINWFAEWFLANDPWKHPVSSRSGGGSGGTLPNKATYYSDGESMLPKINTIIKVWESRDIPTAYTDRWRENYFRGNFNRDKIRRAAWEVGLIGGTAIYLSGDENDGYLGKNYQSDFEAAPDIGCRNYFFEQKINDFGKLLPHTELIAPGQEVLLVANPGEEYIAYSFGGDSFGINLSGTAESYNVEWFNPRTGEIQSAAAVSGGMVNDFRPPFSGDVVLHLTLSKQAAIPVINFMDLSNLLFLPTVINASVGPWISQCP